MSDIQIGKFQVIERLGTGAHSTILHVRRAADSRNYALKVVTVDDPDTDMKFVRQAQHEYRVGRMFDHKHLVKIYTLELVKDWLFRVKKAHLLLEYVNGKTLDACPPLSLPRLVQAFQQVADGVVHMHRKGVYHTDLKPHNILLSRAGAVKIIDFGLAQIRGEKNVRLQGTPEYMAPETASNGLVNERTDIFNFGVTMYRMTTFRLPPSTVTAEAGGLPLTAGTWTKLLKPVQSFNAAAPPVLCDLIHRCLSYDATKRPERMSDVQRELDFLVERMAPTPAERLETMEW
jgi:eukaryotic-like serine/threonine-protein kinase